MRRFFLFVIPAVILISCIDREEKESRHERPEMAKMKDSCCKIRDGLFIHMSAGYGNPHKALMPLKMAMLMAKDHDVALYLDIEAVALVLKDSKDIQFAEFPP